MNNTVVTLVFPSSIQGVVCAPAFVKRLKERGFQPSGANLTIITSCPSSLKTTTLLTISILLPI